MDALTEHCFDYRKQPLKLLRMNISITSLGGALLFASALLFPSQI
jgi:hypothetical protein